MVLCPRFILVPCLHAASRISHVPSKAENQSFAFSGTSITDIHPHRRTMSEPQHSVSTSTSARSSSHGLLALESAIDACCTDPQSRNCWQGVGNPTAPVTPTSSIQEYHFVAAVSATGEFCCMRGVWKLRSKPGFEGGSLFYTRPAEHVRPRSANQKRALSLRERFGAAR